MAPTLLLKEIGARHVPRQLNNRIPQPCTETEGVSEAHFRQAWFELLLFAEAAPNYHAATLALTNSGVSDMR
jgi:hypothetical protein